MTSNLMKSPLAALLFASLLYFSNIFVPYGADYTALYAEFSMPLTSHLFLVLFAFWICLCAAVAFGMAEKGIVNTALLVFATTIGTAYAVPVVETFLFRPKPGFMELKDTLFTAGLRSICTIVIFVLLALIYKTAHIKPEPAKTAPAKPAVEYKLNILGFIIKIIVLPLIFCLLFYVAWYFILWSNDAARAFYEGPAEKLGFVPSIVNSLMNETWMLPFSLLRGFMYMVFAMPLLFMFKSKRVIFIVLTVMFYLSVPVSLLMPTPYIPDDVRMVVCIFNAALLLPYGVITAILLHTSFEKNEIPAAVSAVQKANLGTPAKPNPNDPTVKQAAEVISKTMSGKV